MIILGRKNRKANEKDIKDLLTFQGWHSQELNEAFYLAFSQQGTETSAIPVNLPTYLPPINSGIIHHPSNTTSKRIKSGWDLIKESIRVFNNHPHFLVPLLVTWMIYASIVLYLKYGFNLADYSTLQVLLIIFGVIFLFAFLLAFSCLIVLELIQQLETGEKINLLQSFTHTLTRHVINIIPLVIVWASIWFLLTVIQALLSRQRGGSSEHESFSVQNAAETLVGYQRFSFSRAFFEALKKGVRMIIFLILPAIVWENMGFWKATKKGIALFKAHLTEFITGFILTDVVALLIFLFPVLLFLITGAMEITLPDYVWVITMIYIAFAWSYYIYLEQMFTAQLYLWNMRWEKEVAKAQAEGRPFPSIQEVPWPSVLDEVFELLDQSKVETAKSIIPETSR